MANYKLTYFNIKGRAEVARFIFAQAGVKYEDKRIEKEEWPALKPNTPVGSLPILEVDGKQLTGSLVINRFLAERFNLAGSNDIENAEIAGIIDVLGDFTLRMIALRFEKDEERNAQLKKKLVEEDIPKYWGILEGMCKKNNSDQGWIYGNKPTYADLTICVTLELMLKGLPLTFLENFPAVAELKAAVETETLPNIAEWLKNRPETNLQNFH